MQTQRNLSYLPSNKFAIEAYIFREDKVTYRSRLFREFPVVFLAYFHITKNITTVKTFAIGIKNSCIFFIFVMLKKKVN